MNPEVVGSVMLLKNKTGVDIRPREEHGLDIFTVLQDNCE